MRGGAMTSKIKSVIPCPGRILIKIQSVVNKSGNRQTDRQTPDKT